ncbi:MAG: ATP-binding protein [Candidatus Margulisiibacteriota bacterium]
MQQIISFIIVFLILMLGLASFLKNKYRASNLFFFMFTFFLSFWLIFLFYESESLPSNLAMMLLAADYAVGPIVSLLFLLFCLNFPNESKISSKYALVLLLPIFILIISVASPFLLQNIRFEQLKIIYDMGLFYPIYALIIILYLFVGVVDLIFKYFKSKGNTRNQIQYVLLGLSISATFVIVVNIILQPLLNLSTDISRVGIWGMIFFVLLSTYAITRHHLLDIEVVIKRTMVYSLLTAALTGIFVSLIMASQYLFSSLIGQNTLWVNIAWAFVISLIFTPLRDSIEWLIDRLFFRARYDYQRVLSKYSYSLKQPMADLDRFSSLAPYLLTKSMLLTGASVMVLNRLTQAYDIRATEGDAAPLVRTSFPTDSLLMAELLFREKEITNDELKEAIKNPTLPIEEKEKLSAVLEEMAKLKAALVIPCISESEYFKKPTLIATINLGAKKSGEPFSREDLAFLTTLANQSVISVEYAFIVEELKKNQALTIRTEKLAAIGTTTAGIAHELKNPLTYLSTVAQILPLKWDDLDFRKSVNEMLPSEIQRMQIIIEGLLAYSRNKELELKPFNLQQTLEKTIALVTYEARKNKINIKTNYQHGDAQPLGEANRLVQVFMNLMSNAVQAMADHGGELIISTETDTDTVKISIKDTGPGISHINRAKLFDPFFTTKETGTGLGLAISKKIMEEHHGSIAVDSVLGRGTVFIVSLPRAK